MANTFGTTAERGYGGPHQQERARWKPTVERGEAWCAEVVCLEQQDGRSRWIRPGTSWDLAHDRANPGRYLGPAHRRCNRAEGARFKNRGGRWVQPEPEPRTANRWVL